MGELIKIDFAAERKAQQEADERWADFCKPLPPGYLNSRNHQDGAPSILHDPRLWLYADDEEPDGAA